MSNNIIIGNGDVVQNRLYPELCRRGDSTQIFDINKIVNEQNNLIIKKNSNAIINEIAKTKDNIIWISTPTNYHVPYLKKLIKLNNKLIVVEKPITINTSDLRIVEEINKIHRDKIFYLSYYLLEKALPLFYLKTRNKAYLKYLNVENNNISNSDLGELNNIQIKLIEGADSREWINKQGGQLFETIIHNVLIASLFASLPETWNNTNLNENDNKLIIAATKNKANILLEQQKFAPKCERFAKLKYKNGELIMNINKQILFIKNKNNINKISIKKEYRNKYAIQVDLVNRVASNELKTSECDGLFNQIECLKWLNNLK